MDAKAATGVGNLIDVTTYGDIVVAVTADVNASLTYKFQGSIGASVSSGAAPTFSSAQAVLNHWDYIASYDYQTPGTVITGDTGVTLNNDTVVNNSHLYIVNVSGLTWFSMEITSYTDGALTSWVAGYTAE